MVTGLQTKHQETESTLLYNGHCKDDYYRYKIAQQNNNLKEGWKTIIDLLDRSFGNTTLIKLRLIT